MADYPNHPAQLTKSEHPKLFMILLGSKAPGRNVEQHDYFFGIGHSLKELVPEMRAFWREAGASLHLDGWREVTAVDGYRVSVISSESAREEVASKRLFFINLGGYQEGRFEEQHYTVLTAKESKDQAFREAKKTLFYQQKTFEGPGSFGASAHIDDRYGIDVDDLYEIREILPPSQKERYSVVLTHEDNLAQDLLHLGYFKVKDLV